MEVSLHFKITVTDMSYYNFCAGAITQAELLAMHDKTNRHLRLRELVMENSLEANLVVM